MKDLSLELAQNHLEGNELSFALPEHTEKDCPLLDQQAGDAASIALSRIPVANGVIDRSRSAPVGIADFRLLTNACCSSGFTDAPARPAS